MNFYDVKIRPVVLVLSLGIVVGLNAYIFLNSPLSDVDKAIVGMFLVCIAGVATKLIESEEKGE